MPLGQVEGGHLLRHLQVLKGDPKSHFVFICSRTTLHVDTFLLANANLGG